MNVSLQRVNKLFNTHTERESETEFTSEASKTQVKCSINWRQFMGMKFQ